MDIRIKTNLREVDVFLDNLKLKIMGQATRASINKSIRATRTHASKEVRSYLNLKAREFKEDHTKSIMARGSKLESIYGEISFSGHEIPLLKFVTGDKSTIQQKGIPVKKRRTLKVKIRRGKSIKATGAFIQKVRTKQVFRRGRSGKLYKQSVPSVAHYIRTKMALRQSLERKAKDVYWKNFENQWSWRLEKERNKLKNARLR